MTDAYYAEKMPQGTGKKAGVFFDIEEAHEWLEDAIAADPEITRWKVTENAILTPSHTYHVVEGVGEVAGVIYQAPIRGALDSDHSDAEVLDKRHHNAPKDGNDDPIFAE